MATPRRDLPPGNLVISAALLPQLKAGMKRVEVEALIGMPAPDRILPATINDGRLRYHTAYEVVQPDMPMTIRPIKPLPRVQPVKPLEPLSVALEFDASQTGHPLVEIHYPDPLF